MAVVPSFLCPSDSTNPKVHNGSTANSAQGFRGNYVLNAGNGFFNPGGFAASGNLNGLFFPQSHVTAAHVRDGLSNTLLGSEIVLVPDGAIGSVREDVRGRYTARVLPGRHRVEIRGSCGRTTTARPSPRPAGGENGEAGVVQRHRRCFQSKRRPQEIARWQPPSGPRISSALSVAPSVWAASAKICSAVRASGSITR